MLVDHLFYYRISPWLKTAEKKCFFTCVTDIPSDRQTDPLIEMHSRRMHLKTRPDTQQDSRGRYDRSRNIKTARNLEIFPTDGPTRQGVESHVRD